MQTITLGESQFVFLALKFPFHLAVGRSRGGRGGGYRDDRRDRYSGGRRDYNYNQDSHSNDRSYDNGPKKPFSNKTQNGAAYSNGSGSYNENSNNGFNGAYNGQSNFNGSQAGNFGSQGFQNKQFSANQGAAPNGANHNAQFPFNSQQQPMQPMMPFSMPPPNFQ